jgi:hypothetical protein
MEFPRWKDAVVETGVLLQCDWQIPGAPMRAGI